MKVIFIKDLKKQGRVNEVKEVSDGYATNYLIKNGYAFKYTKTSKDILSQDIENQKLVEEKRISDAEKLKVKIEKLELKFEVASNKGKVFGSVSSKQICYELGKKGINVDKKMIVIDSPLSSLGVHEITVNLHKKVSAKLRVQLISK